MLKIPQDLENHVYIGLNVEAMASFGGSPLPPAKMREPHPP
ncbi:hypothetical protein ABENE_21920 [Asticcacaulis benevestitus DSM 16100 = ATCC BAA-896]|uniref:Uncharacterized protein n=1 Tax=Asticcacaulis benevestitus DSM 16100 = ATCC BAA-896 TaxID=1121022 RepID=V4P2U8_9CAUL|nr:hypothetical protein ABENE_21920 [Asticcacaulis benevestitus DSM 16100 = ATCC BAA-896]